MIIDGNTFSIEDPMENEIVTPIKDIYKAKFDSDGNIEKLKTRLVVRGDLQDPNINEDKWPPTASFRSLKAFLANASRLKCRVRQGDFIGAYLQANVCSKMFVMLPAIFGELFPEWKEYCGRPLRLRKSM